MMIRGFWAFALCLALGANSYSQMSDCELDRKAPKLEIQDCSTDLGPNAETRKLLAQLDGSAEKHYKLGQYDEAQPLYIRSLAIKEEVYGPVAAETAHTLRDLAVNYEGLGRLDKSLPLKIRALLISENLDSKSHDTAIDLNNLASTYYRLGR